MKFNYQMEKKKFEAAWEQLEKEYREAGMSEEAICEMKHHDWRLFKKERIFCLHNQYIAGQFFEDEDELEIEKNPLLEKYLDRLSTSDEYLVTEKYDWIENLENERLAEGIRQLGKERIDLLMMYAFDQKTQEQIAKELGISRRSVRDRIERIKNNLKKFI